MTDAEKIASLESALSEARADRDSWLEKYQQRFREMDAALSEARAALEEQKRTLFAAQQALLTEGMARNKAEAALDAARREERDECARVADGVYMLSGVGSGSRPSEVAAEIARAIRARTTREQAAAPEEKK